MSRRREREEPPVNPAQLTHVELVSGARTVVVESADCLDVVEAAAVRLWPLTAGSAAQLDTPMGFVSSAGATSEAAGQELMPPEVAMPTHLLIPLQDTPDDERRRGWL